MSIKTAILAIVKSELKSTLLTGKVVSVDESNMTCEIDLIDAPNIYDVRIRAVIDEVAKGLLILPKIGSVVVIALIDNKITSSTIVKYSEVESIKWICDDIQLNGDSNGGLVISEKVAEQDNVLKQELNDLKQIFTTWVPTVYDGGAALKASLSTWLSPVTNKSKDYYESKKVTHGE